MALQYIEYNGKSYPVKIGYNAIMRFQNKTKKKLEDIDDDMRLYQPLLYYGLQMGAEIEGEKLDLTQNDMAMMLEEVYWDFVLLFPKFFPTDLAEKLKGDGGKENLKKG